MKNVFMYYTVGLLLTLVLLKSLQHYRRMSGCAVLMYVIVLLIDLVVGCSIIFWKCSIRKSEEECELAIGGTMGSVIVWLIVLLVCPCFATRCEICVTIESIRKKCAQYMEKLRPRKSHDVSIDSIVQAPTTVPLLYKGQDLLTVNGVIPHIENDPQRTDTNISQIYICNERSEARNHGSNMKYQQSDDT